MEDLILISSLNDYVFCPISIYFHNLYSERNNTLYQSTFQTKGKNAHKTIDQARYSSCKDVYSGISVYSEKYGLVGKIDVLDHGRLVERKRKVIRIYDGYVFQLYGQCVALREMSYTVSNLAIHSLEDNKSYNVQLPENNPDMFEKFEAIVNEMRTLDVDKFQQTTKEKCLNCIYEAACDRSLL